MGLPMEQLPLRAAPLAQPAGLGRWNPPQTFRAKGPTLFHTPAPVTTGTLAFVLFDRLPGPSGWAR